MLVSGAKVGCDWNVRAGSWSCTKRELCVIKYPSSTGWFTLKVRPLSDYLWQIISHRTTLLRKRCVCCKWFSYYLPVIRFIKKTPLYWKAFRDKYLNNALYQIRDEWFDDNLQWFWYDYLSIPGLVGFNLWVSPLLKTKLSVHSYRLCIYTKFPRGFDLELVSDPGNERVLNALFKSCTVSSPVGKK